MSTDAEDPLLRLAEAVAQGTPVDWARELAAQPELRPELEQLRALEAMAALPRHAAPDPLLGRQLSHYRIRERLGAGGMGVVYRAEDQRLHRPVALKVLPPELVASEERRRRLLREARAGAAVVHPSVAAVHEVGEDQGTVFVAMELVEGEALQQRIAGQPLPLHAALQVAIEMADGLAAAHQAHVIHRDLKPANVVIRPDGHVKILDFGLAKLREEERSGSSEASRPESLPAEPTREGRLLGTPAYMSPEQVRGEPLDGRSDLFSFGSTLYEMVTGQAPFRRASAAETLTAILRDEPSPASRLHPELPPRLEEILARCLAKDPAQRYPGAGELAADLRALASGAAVAPGSPPTAKTRRLAAILFSDIVGYTALMAADEARALAVRERHRALLRPTVERFHGELIETPGDEALAVFASSLRAVECALALQAALRDADDLRLRIGVHVGDVLFRDGEVVGEGVNVAARIRSLAVPGGICVSAAVYEQVKNHPHLRGRSLGSRSLKGIARPVEHPIACGAETPLQDHVRTELLTDGLEIRIGVPERERSRRSWLMPRTAFTAGPRATTASSATSSRSRRRSRRRSRPRCASIYPRRSAIGWWRPRPRTSKRIKRICWASSVSRSSPPRAAPTGSAISSEPSISIRTSPWPTRIWHSAMSVGPRSAINHLARCSRGPGSPRPRPWSSTSAWRRRTSRWGRSSTWRMTQRVPRRRSNGRWR